MKNLMKKNYDFIIVYASIVLAVILRILCRDFRSEDYETFLVNWVKFFRENGGFCGLSHPVGDYNVVYQYILIIISYIKFSDLYLIKLVSCFFDFLMAAGCAKCIEATCGDKKKARLCFSCVLLLPTVWINSSLWGQCDSIYVAFIIWSIYFLLVRKNYLSIAFLSLAFTFKLQTVFIFPLFFAEFLKKNIKFRHCLVFPAVYILTCIPALAFGKTFTEIISIYFNQTTEYPQMVMSAPSLMQIFELVTYNGFTAKLGIAIAFVFSISFCLFSFRKNEHDKKHILSLCLIMSLGIPFFLPHMHDRYFYMAGIFALLYTFAYGKKRVWIFILTEISSLIFYMHFFYIINLYGGKIITHLLTHPNGATLMLFVLSGVVILYLYDFSKLRINLKYAGITAFLLTVSLSITAQVITSKNRIVSKLDGKYANHCGITCVKKDDTLMVPLRTIFNTAGYTVAYDTSTSSTKLESADETIYISIPSQTAIKGEKIMTLSYPCIIENNTTFISKDDVCLLLDMSVTQKGNVLYFESTP